MRQFAISLAASALALASIGDAAFIMPRGNLATRDLLQRNIAYRSPSKQVSGPGLSFDVKEVETRVKRNHLAKRKTSLDETWDPSIGPYGQEAYKGNVTFEHGVASGDPFPTSAILWTRVTAPEAQENDEAICLRYQVSRHSDFSDLIDGNYAWTSSDVDYTLKVEAINLQPKSEYYYRFSTCHDHRQTSAVGKLKTTPTQDDPDVEKVGFAVFSCANLPFGFFNSYAAAARADDVDYALHLGDYIYESKGDGSPDAYGDGRSLGRVSAPNKEIVTLSDYRIRHAQYKTDRGSQALHSNKTLIAVWDDHELADNSWKGGSADSNNTQAGTIDGVKFTDRKRNAVRAYFEYMPVRQVDTTDDLRIWRSFQYGKLVDIMMLDTRQYERDITDLYYNTAEVAAMSNDTQRSLMGGKQESWFYDQLRDSKKRNSKWKLIGQQILFTPLSYGEETFPVNYDAWDGYNANRDRVLKTIKDDAIDNVIFLAGDSHSSWVTDVIPKESINDTAIYDPSTGRGAVAVEFGGTAISSPPSFGRNLTSEAYNEAAQRLVTVNRPLHYAETQYRGYYTLHLSAERAMATYWATPNITTEGHESFALARFEVESGQNKLSRPINGGKKPASGAIQAEVVKYDQQKWNGTAFA